MHPIVECHRAHARMSAGRWFYLLSGYTSFGGKISGLHALACVFQDQGIAELDTHPASGGIATPDETVRWTRFNARSSMSPRRASQCRARNGRSARDLADCATSQARRAPLGPCGSEPSPSSPGSCNACRHPPLEGCAARRSNSPADERSVGLGPDGSADDEAGVKCALRTEPLQVGGERFGNRRLEHLRVHEHGNWPSRNARQNACLLVAVIVVG